MTALLTSALAAALVYGFFVRLRTDMADFVPTGRGRAAQMMTEEIRNGEATRLVLVGVEGAPEADLARVSRSVADRLRSSGLFGMVANGGSSLGDAAREFLFRDRYLLSPTVTADSFTQGALRQDFAGLLRGLESSAEPLVAQYGFADPTGAALGLIRNWAGSSHVRLIDGVWFASDRPRALLVARINGAGMDIAAADRALAALRAAFAAANPGGARLLLAGPAVFAQEAAHAIRSDVELISIVSTLLVAALLVWRFRSPFVVAAIAVPIILGITVAGLAVQLVFGFVHGIAFGFGMTMLGVTVDYPVLLIGHRKLSERADATLRRIGRSFNLAVFCAALGLTGMAGSGFPGLAQLGLFSVFGVLTAAAATRFLLPPLIVAADLAPVAAGDPRLLGRLEELRRLRAPALLLIAAAAIGLALHPPRWQRDVQALSPVRPASRTLDASLRAELGAPDAGQLLMVQGESADDVLRREEALLPALHSLRRRGDMSGAQAAARFLPSAETQLSRRALLPDPATLAARVAGAQRGLPFRDTAFGGFQADVSEAGKMAPVRLQDITIPALAAALDPLLHHSHDGNWIGIVAPEGVTNPAAVREAGERAGAVWLDMRAETNRLMARATAQAWRWLAGGTGAAVLMLFLWLREPRRAARVAGSVGAALLVTLAALTFGGESLSLINLVALQFVAGVGLDYALFFSRPQLDLEERMRTLRTLVTCNAMSLLTFGLLVLCRTPLLRQIGITVAIGVVAAMSCAFLFAGPRPSPEPA